MNRNRFMRDFMTNDNRGVALLVTITVLFVIFAMVSEVNRRVRNSIRSVSVQSTRTTLSAAAISGVHIGIALLMADKKNSTTDTVQEAWADPEEIKALLAEFDFGDAAVSLKITDELGKIQINALVEYPEGKKFNEGQKSMWEYFLKLVNPPDESVESIGENTDIINSVKDWLDFGDDDAITGINGAEDDYYRGLDPPYPCGNGPLKHLGELALIKGLGEEVWDKSETGLTIGDLMTVYGMVEGKGGTATRDKKRFAFPGKININTAELPVILALMPKERSDLENSMAAEAIYEFRNNRNEDGFTGNLDGKWYLTCPGCGESGIKEDLLTLSSDFFKIESTAVSNGIRVVVSTVIRRRDKEGQYDILSWQEY